MPFRPLFRLFVLPCAAALLPGAVHGTTSAGDRERVIRREQPDASLQVLPEGLVVARRHGAQPRGGTEEQQEQQQQQQQPPSRQAVWQSEVDSTASLQPPEGGEAGASLLDGAGASGNAAKESKPPVFHSDEKSSLTCGESWFSPSNTHCPSACPYLAEDNDTKKTCYFRCVESSDCGGPGTKYHDDVADNESKVCRPCRVYGCKTCQRGLDVCSVCMDGYKANEDKPGTCVGSMAWIWTYILPFVAVLVIVLIVWYLELLCRPCPNMEGYAHGAEYRDSTVVDMRGDSGTDQTEGRACHEKKLYPLTVNLMRNTLVGGAGLCLHMRFQVFIVIWSAVLAISFYCLSAMTSGDLLELGMQHAGNNAELCSLIKWGNRKTEELKIVKLGFMLFAYLFTLMASVVFGLVQEFAYRHLSHNAATMKDFAMRLEGLPPVPGTEKPEDEIAELIEAKTSNKVVGVSICWDYAKHQETIQNIIDDELERLEIATNPQWQKPLEPPTPAPDGWNAWEQGGPRILRSLLGTIDTLWRVYMWGIPLEKDPPKTPEEIKELAKSLTTSRKAFVVFETEEDRDLAVFKLHFEDLMYRGHKITVTTEKLMPAVVLWENFLASEDSGRCGKILRGLANVSIVIFIWTFVLYIPYAYYMTSQIFARGDAVGGWNYWFFVAIVVGGNQVMYMICDVSATIAGFENEDERQVCYNCLYALAVFLCSLMDLAVTSIITYLEMCNAGVHTSDGRLISDLVNFQDVIESYPMQRALGNTLFMYCFPSTFILPFIIEAVCCLWVMDHISGRITKSRPEIRGRLAERAMAWFMTMNMCRYGDIAFNVTLAVMVFFVATGYTLHMFVSLALCHMFLYLYDHWRIIRKTPAFCYATNLIDRFAQALMAVPCGFILCGVIFNGAALFAPDASFGSLSLLCFCCLVVHCILHLRLLLEFVPNMAQFDLKATTAHYGQVARASPPNWFSTNPIHVIRSKYIFNHAKPLCFYQSGKEHLMWANQELGLFFQSKHWDEKGTTAWDMLQSQGQAVQSSGAANAAESPPVTT